MKPESWQVKNWEYLTTLNQIPHSLLLYGAKGLGVLSFAHMLSAWLLCESQGAIPCGQCYSCQWIKAGTHPDLLVITPESSTIKVEAIREIRAFSENKRHSGRYKIIVISPAESMNTSAANALLKVLEEPFENTIFLLVAHNIVRVLPTILSRCQKVYFPSLDKKSFAIEMKQRQVVPDNIELLYELSHGEPLAFSSESEQHMVLAAQKKVIALMEKCLGQTISPTEAAEQIKKIEKENQISFESLVDIMSNWVYQQTKLQNLPYWYKIYDKLVLIKKYLTMGSPINQTLWLEDLFYAC